MRMVNNGEKSNIYAMPRFMFSKVVIIGVILGLISPVILLFEIVIGLSYFINTFQCVYFISRKDYIYSESTNLILDSIINGYAALGSFFLGRIIGMSIIKKGFYFLIYALDKEPTYPFILLYPDKVAHYIQYLDIGIKVIITVILIVSMAFIQWKILLKTVRIQKRIIKKDIENRKKIKEIHNNKKVEKRSIKIGDIGDIGNVRNIENKENTSDKFQRMKKKDYY